MLTAAKPWAVAALVALLVLPSAPEALAWGKVCLENKGKYDAKLVVVYGFDTSDNKLPHWAAAWTKGEVGGDLVVPVRHYQQKAMLRFPNTIWRPEKVAGFDRAEIARGAIVSREAGPRREACVDIRKLAHRDAFFAAVWTAWDFMEGERWAVCGTERANRHPFHVSEHRHFRELWLRSEGSGWDPQCFYAREVAPD